MCHAFHMIIVREVGGTFGGFCVCCGIGGVMCLW